jgi:hypothetical protein
VTAQGVQVRAGGPHLRELELLAGVEVAGAAADPAGEVTNLGRSRDGGRRGCYRFSLFEHPAAELSVDDSAQLGEDRR